MRIPGYRLKRLIAEGGMSTVYLALQESLGRRVALKVLKRFDSPQHAERFLHEARIIASLQHRNIITIHDVGSVRDRHYIAMEYLQGGSLADRIDQGMQPAAALDLLESIAGCLDFVHRRDIVHRDIKPSNILFHADGTPKLSDFGIAKQLDADQEMTMDGSAFGSPYYLSPEQAECRPLDGRSDIYSLGIVFYQMLTGRRPYAEKSHIETIVAHLSQPIPLLPEQLLFFQGLLERMIAKRPDDRVASAHELLQLIRKARSVAPESDVGHDARHHAVQADVGEERSDGILGRLRGISKLTRATVAVALLGLATVMLWQPDGRVTGQVSVATNESRPAKPIQVQGHPGAGVFEKQVVLRFPERMEPVTRPAPEVSPETKKGDSAVAKAAAAESVPVEPDEAGVPVELAAPSDELIVAVGQSAHLDEADTAIVAVDLPAQTDHVIAQADQPAQPDLIVSDGPSLASGAPVERFDEWMSAGDRALQANRLTTPAGDNAYGYYRQVVEIEPGHAAANAGVDGIADRYASLVRRALDKKNYRRARLYVQRGVAVRPQHVGLLAMRSELDEIDRAAALAQANEAAEKVMPVPVEPRITLMEFEGTSVNSRGPEGTGNIVKDFKHVWRSVFD